jgi:hypothetical protein
MSPQCVFTAPTQMIGPSDSARSRAVQKRIKGKSFTIDGKAVLLGPDGLSRFEELSRREAADTAILYAFDLIEHNGEDIHNRPFLDRKAVLARFLRNAKAGILLDEHIAENGVIEGTEISRLPDPRCATRKSARGGPMIRPPRSKCPRCCRKAFQQTTRHRLVGDRSRGAVD